MVADKKRIFIILLASWLIITTIFLSIVAIFLLDQPAVLAALGMLLGLITLWVFLGGGIMYKLRDRIKGIVSSIKIDWRIMFILFATFLALVEEAITTTMTNLAPFFGVRIGEAYITASANYLDVILFHSVVVFVPMFIAWAWLLSRYDFSPFKVFLLFGITGTLAEAAAGLHHLSQFGLWIFVYGLMVYLPAYTIPRTRGARSLKPWHYLLAIIIPLILATLMAIFMGTFFSHPRIHF
jgi:hypothetical protein